MGADGSRRYLERATNLLVGLSVGNHPCDLYLATSQPRGAGSDSLGRRPHTALAHLVARSGQFLDGAESRQHIVGLAQLPGPLFAFADFHQRPSEFPPDARRLWREWNRLELLRGSTQKTNRATRIAVGKPDNQAVTRVRVRKSEPMVNAVGITTHPRRMTPGALEIAREKSSLAYNG